MYTLYFFQYKYVSWSIIHSIVQGWVQCKTCLILAFPFWEVLIIYTTNCWTISHGYFADHYIKTEKLFEKGFLKCVKIRSTGPDSFYQNSCLLICYVFLETFALRKSSCGKFYCELYLAKQLLFWIGCFFGNAHIYVECKNHLFSEYFMNLFLLWKLSLTC